MYRAKRYMEHSTEAELAQRYKDILANLTQLTAEGKIKIRHHEEGGAYWMELFIHIFEEYALRKRGVPPGYSLGEVQLPVPSYPAIPKAARATQGRHLVPGSYLVKYGKQKYLRRAVESGIIRVAPASYYSDPSLNPALWDNELEITVEVRPSDGTISLRNKKTGTWQEISVSGNIKVTNESLTNYYIMSLSRIYDYRLFDDFGADSCLLIFRPREFIERIAQGMRKELSEWTPDANPVSYVDPLNMGDSHIDVFFTKHFRYAYQMEYRAIWLPPESKHELAPVCLAVEPLSDCADLLSLD
jgi:hypothetical protein